MKAFQKIICAIVSLSVVAATMTCMATSSSAVANTPGDVNSDGSVNSFDALSVVRYCTGADTLTKEEIVAADVDLDGKVTSTDALYILQFSAGIIDRFPAQTDAGRVHIFGDFYYDKATGKVTNTDGSGLLGFSYDAKDGAFYASTYAWQRTFGYTYLYDVAAPLILCNFDTSRIFFEYNDMEWMVQLWKGQFSTAARLVFTIVILTMTSLLMPTAESSISAPMMKCLCKWSLQCIRTILCSSIAASSIHGGSQALSSALSIRSATPRNPLRFFV